MIKIAQLIKKVAATTLLFVLAAGSFGTINTQKAQAVAPIWDATGNYVLNMNYLGTNYPHTVSLTQDSSGNLTGSGTSGAYSWTITSGSVVGNAITFTANYTATADAVTPQTTMTVIGTIANDGTISGTWSDNYQGSPRSGTFTTASGAADLAGSLQAQDFGVMDMSGVKGYTAGWGLTNADFTGAQSIVVKLYSGSTLLQTDTAINPTTEFAGLTQISSPFDVFGTFNYPADGYWTNVRESEYGQTLIPDKVVATVTLANGKVVTAQNTNLTGDTASIFPAPGPVKVTIVKYMDGVPATANNSNSSSFAMNATWNATNIGSGSGSFNLGTTGFNNANAYQATTADMTSGASYSVSEVMNSTTGTSCDVDNAAPYSLVGYTSGNTLQAAAAATPSSSVSLNNITSDKYIIVWNHDCNVNVNANVTTNAATNITDTNATLNGTNGSSAAIGHSFWVSTSPFVTTSPTIPAGVYSTVDLGPIAANTAFSANLSSATGIPAITPNTTYYYAAWSNIGGTWYPGQVLHFTTTNSTIGGNVGGVGTLKVDSIDTIKGTATADGSFTDGFKYVFHITVPTDEPGLAMKFSDWARTGGNGTIPVANNMRVSSAQASNTGTILLTAANSYSTPDMHMVTDLDPNTDGIQATVTVEVAVPNNTPNGAYTTTYGIRSE